MTSKADEPWVRFSPFWPHGNIPVPFSEGVVGTCVEGIWQALKVFESEDVDASKLHVTNMKGLKRTVRRLGGVLGHRKHPPLTQAVTFVCVPARSSFSLTSLRRVSSGIALRTPTKSTRGQLSDRRFRKAKANPPRATVSPTTKIGH